MKFRRQRDTIRDAELGGDLPDVANPASAPLRQRGGTARRERPTFERAVGRWRARGRVVPITGARNSPAAGLVVVGERSGDAGVTYEAVIEWYGPPLPEFGRQPGRRPVDAQTSVICDDDHELARAVVVAALELIDRGEVPFMDSLRAALRHAGPERRDAWVPRYRELVGDDGLAAAEGYV